MSIFHFEVQRDQNGPDGATSYISSNLGLTLLLVGLEGEVLDVALHSGVAPVAPDEPLGVEDGVLGVGRELVLGRVADQSLALLGEGHVRRGYPVALVVRDDVDAAVPHHSDTAKSEIMTYLNAEYYTYSIRSMFNKRNLGLFVKNKRRFQKWGLESRPLYRLSQIL